jgi:hypothetical protein
MAKKKSTKLMTRRDKGRKKNEMMDKNMFELFSQ